jgi:hypothetical protein
MTLSPFGNLKKVFPKQEFIRLVYKVTYMAPENNCTPINPEKDEIP